MNLKELDSFRIADAISFHDKLNSNLWNGQRLRPEVKDQLLLIAKDFLEELGVNDLDVVDITVSGSNAAYSYTPHSDLDLHILVDLSKLDNNEIYRELFNAKKNIYNDTHNITVHGVPVELYVQDAREPVVSLGEYSILQDKWLRIPTKRRANLDQTATKQKYEKLHKVITKTLQTNNILQVSKVLHKIKQYRKAGLDAGGEFGPENLAYKVLRKQGLIDKLYDLRDKLHSKELTIDEDMNSEIHNYPKLDKILTKLCRMIVKGQISQKGYGMVAACVLDPNNNIVAGLNSPGVDGKRIHAERVAIEKYENKYGPVPKGSIVITTLSPCNEHDDETAANRVGDSCTDYLNSKGIEKVYCGYIDPTQDNDQRQFNLMETGNQDIREECKSFADTFLEEDSYTMASGPYAAEKTMPVTPYGNKEREFRGSIAEAFDQPYKLKWEKGDYGDVDAYAKLDDGNYLSIMFNKGYNQDKEEAWSVEFFRNNSQEVTGEGDAHRVFATVLSAIQTFIKKYKPNKVIFSASKEVEDGQNAQSRARLYDSLVQRYARAWGFKAFRADTGNKVIYELSKIKKDVAEGSDNIPTIGINVRDDGDIHYADLIVDGKKKYESRRTNSLNPYIGKTVGIVRTGNGPAVAIGQATIGKPIIVDAHKFDKLRDQHLVPKNSKFDIDIDGTKYLYPMINPIRWDNEKPIKHKGIVSRKIQEQGVAEGFFDRFKKHLTTDRNGIHLTVTKDERRLIVDAIYNDERIGNAIFQRQGKNLVAAGVGVAHEYQGKGIGKIIYDWVKELGYTINRSPHQTDAGKGFWDKHKGVEQNVWEASGYIPSEKEKNDPRFKTALTVDIKPDSIKKNAKAFSWLTSRAGIPPTAKPNGTI